MVEIIKEYNEYKEDKSVMLILDDEARMLKWSVVIGIVIFLVGMVI